MEHVSAFDLNFFFYKFTHFKYLKIHTFSQI